jgi:hypothetical protein
MSTEPTRDALDDYAALLARTGVHPPNECGDPYDCPAHSGQFRGDNCPECNAPRVLVEEFDEQIGVEEQARPVRVTVLACGHEIVSSSALYVDRE